MKIQTIIGKEKKVMGNIKKPLLGAGMLVCF